MVIDLSRVVLSASLKVLELMYGHAKAAALATAAPTIQTREDTAIKDEETLLHIQG